MTSPSGPERAGRVPGPGPAALDIVNADIRTLDPAQPRVRELFVRDGVIVAPVDARGSAAPRFDAGGRTITPGFTDAHTHLLTWARSRTRISLAGASTLDEILERVRAAHAAQPDAAWLVGQDAPPLTSFTVLPHARDLDRAAPGRKVCISTRDLHSAWVSSAALSAAGLSTASAAPAGGMIGMSRSGLDGLLYENATRLVLDHVPEPPPARVAEELARALAQLARCGVTAVHDFGNLEGWNTLAALRAEGALTVRVAFGFMAAGAGAWRRAVARPDPAQLDSDALLWPFAIKAFLDGTLGSHTAHLLAPYEGTDDQGLATLAVDELDRLGELARARDLTLAVHAIGDAAVRAALDAFARWPAGERVRLRPRIEHAQLVDPADRARFKELGVVASMQPMHAVSDRAVAAALWGARDEAGGYGWRQLTDAGAPLAFGSDVPVEDPDPRLGLWAAVTGGAAQPEGRRPQRALDLDHAFAAYTTGAAWSVRREGVSGRLVPGCVADFVLWGEDPWRVDADRLRTLAIDATWVGGRCVHGENAGRPV